MNLLTKSLDNEKILILYGDDDIIVNINFLTDVSNLPYRYEFTVFDLFADFPVACFVWLVSVFAKKLYTEVSII